MIKLISTLIVILALYLPAFGQKEIKEENRKKTPVTLEDLWLKGTFMPQFPNEFRWMKDDHYYSVMEEGGIARYSIKNEQKVEDLVKLSAIPLKGMEVQEIESYEFNEDETKILLTAKSESIYRHSSKEVCAVWDRDKKKFHLLQEGKKISNATFSPNGTKVAYVFENNLYLYDLNLSESIAITTDGKNNAIINGATDWVYEEEFSFKTAFDWSPKSDRIAFYRFDESDVKEFSMEMYGSLYPTQYTFKYPKAGEKNALVDIYLYDIPSKKLIQADLGAVKDQYIPRIKWTQNNDILAVMKMNRLQNQLDIIQINAETGKSTVMLTEKSNTYIDVSDDKWIFLKNHPDMLWLSEQNGFNHIYRYAMDGKLINQITTGLFEVSSVLGVDEANDRIYYLSTEISPLERHLYHIGLDGKGKTRITKATGTHDITLSSAYTYFVDSYSTMEIPGTTDLCEAKDGKVMKNLINNEALRKKLATTELGKPEFFTFKNDENITLNGWMIKPADFQKNKKYPVLMYVYGGPGSQTVQNQWGYSNYLWYQLLASKGYIVVSVDGRGTGARGADFKKCTYADMGKIELHDQVETAKYLQTLSYVDKNRIGIWGWSFGGYMTSLCLTKGNGIFKAGIAVAPVTNWRFYDTIYTERYLKTPQENAAGYDENSPINYAKDLKGNYLLVHGSADDNVHLQNSMEWITALVKSGKQFEMMVYPNKNHSIGGGAARYHLYSKMTDFILKNL